MASPPRLKGPKLPLFASAGTVPVPGEWPAGCRFNPRCPQVMPVCTKDPPVVRLTDGQWMRCWLGQPSPGEAAGA